jgi:hypothetical protein
MVVWIGSPGAGEPSGGTRSSALKRLPKMGYRLVDRPKPARGQTGLVVVACRLRPKLGKCGVMG